MWPVVFVILLALLAFNMCSPTAQYPDGSAYHGYQSGKQPPRCNRASCWDDKSGHFIGADEWDRRMKDRLEDQR